jgi:hypothetical protein
MRVAIHRRLAEIDSSRFSTMLSITNDDHTQQKQGFDEKNE